MYRYILKRLLLLIPVLIGISIIIFTIINLTPGNPGRLILGEQASPQAIEELNIKLGYYDPLPVKYFNYMKNLLMGDFGNSYRTGAAVMEEISYRFPTTLLLSVLVMVTTTVVSIPLGVLVALKKDTIVDGIGMVIALIFTAMPSFWLGMILMLVFALYLNLLPATGSDTFANFILPTITISMVSIAQIMRMTRSSMLEVIRQDYIRTAIAKGAPNKVVVWRHAVRNALMPVITTIGVNFGYTLGGSVLTESVFGMRGVGTLLLTAIRSKDVPVVMGCVLLMSFLFSIVTLLVDLSYGLIDPRIKSQYAKAKR